MAASGRPRRSRCASTSQRAQTASTCGQRAGLDDRGHPLLRLRDHDLERLHARLAQRHADEVDVEADAAARRPSRTSTRRGRPRPGPAARRRGRASSSSSVHSISFLPVNGSPIWTLGRLASEPSSKPCEASTLAPPMPSRPVRRRRTARAGCRRPAAPARLQPLGRQHARRTSRSRGSCARRPARTRPRRRRSATPTQLP